MAHSDQAPPNRYQTNYRDLRAALRRVVQVGNERGWAAVASFFLGQAVSRLSLPFGYARARLRPNPPFTLADRSYQPFTHFYTKTWRNERAVEIPVLWEIVQAHQGARILEVGNVLSHFFPVRHQIVDKFERAPGVLNVDIADFHPAERYDLIVSISTIEHVGWDDRPRDADKPRRVLAHLQSLLAPGGLLVVTLPIGYNPHLDQLLRDHERLFSRRLCLQRISRHNRWHEVPWSAIAHARYGAPFPAANGLLIGFGEAAASRDNDTL